MEVISNLPSSTPFQGVKDVRSHLDFTNLSPIEGMPSSIEPEECLETEPAKLKKATVLEMVIEAINTVGVPRKGASYQSIKKWITEYKEIDSRRLKFFLKIALKKGIDQGILVKPFHSVSAVNTVGFFKIAKTKPVTSSKTFVKKTVNKTSANKVDKIPAKSAKSRSTKNVTKTIKRLYKQPEAEKKLVKSSTKAKAAIEKKFAKVTKTPPKEVEKKPSKKDAATKHPTTGVSSEAEKPVKKAHIKAAVEKKPAKKAATKKHATEVLSKPEAEKPVKKAPLKPAVEKKAAATKQLAADAPPKAEAEKSIKKAPIRVAVAKKHANQTPIKVVVPKKHGIKTPIKVAVAKKPTKKAAAKKPASEMPLKSEAEKPTTEGPSKSKALKPAIEKKTRKKATSKKPATKVPSEAEA